MISSASERLVLSWPGDGGSPVIDAARFERDRASRATISDSRTVSPG